jgi:hypothetical protein
MILSQSVINGGQLKLAEQKKGHRIAKQPFFVKVINFESKRILVNLHKAESTKGKEVVTTN